MILVTGATGNVGGELVEALRERGAPVRAVMRRPRPVGEGVDVVEGDLDDASSIAPHLQDVAGMFLLSGYQATPDLLAAAVDAGVQHATLLSAASAVSTAGPGNAVAAYHRESEELVRGSGLAWTALRPTSFMSNTLRWLDQLAEGDDVVEPFPDAATATVDPADIAAVAAVALVDRSLDGRALTVTGPEPLLPAQRLAIIGEALGRDLRLVGVPPGQVRDHLLAQMPERYADAFIEFFLEGTADESVPASTVEDVLGRPPKSYRDWVAENVDRLRTTPTST